MAHVQFIVIFGTRWTFKSAPGGWDGKLNCPDCGVPTRMVELDAIKAFTLYWFPLLKLENGGRLLECRDCLGKWELPPELRNEADSAGAFLADPVEAEV